MMDDRWLSVDEICEYLGIKRDIMYRWIDRRNMPAHKRSMISKQTCFMSEDFGNWRE